MAPNPTSVLLHLVPQKHFQFFLIGWPRLFPGPSIPRLCPIGFLGELVKRPVLILRLIHDFQGPENAALRPEPVLSAHKAQHLPAFEVFSFSLNFLLLSPGSCCLLNQL